MLTAAVIVLAVLAVLLLIVAAAFALLWRAADLDATDRAEHVAELEELARVLTRRVRHQQGVIRRYRAEFWALADQNSPPPAASAALAPDDPSLLPAEVEQWLRERNDR